MRLHFSLYLFYTLRGVRFSAGYCIIAKSTQTGYPTQRNTFFTEGKHNEKSCIDYRYPRDPALHAADEWRPGQERWHRPG